MFSQKTSYVEKYDILYIDNNLFTCRVVLDFTKAFDTVNHAILLDKLLKKNMAFGVVHYAGSQVILPRDSSMLVLTVLNQLSKLFIFRA